MPVQMIGNFTKGEISTGIYHSRFYHDHRVRQGRVSTHGSGIDKTRAARMPPEQSRHNTSIIQANWYLEPAPDETQDIDIADMKTI